MTDLKELDRFRRWLMAPGNIVLAANAEYEFNQDIQSWLADCEEELRMAYAEMPNALLEKIYLAWTPEFRFYGEREL